MGAEPSVVQLGKQQTTEHARYASLPALNVEITLPEGHILADYGTIPDLDRHYHRLEQLYGEALQDPAELYGIDYHVRDESAMYHHLLVRDDLERTITQAAFGFQEAKLLYMLGKGGMLEEAMWRHGVKVTLHTVPKTVGIWFGMIIGAERAGGKVDLDFEAGTYQLTRKGRVEWAPPELVEALDLYHLALVEGPLNLCGYGTRIM